VHGYVDLPLCGETPAREVRSPGIRRPRAETREAPRPQQSEHSIDRAVGLDVDAARRDHQDSPTIVVDRLASAQIGLSLVDPLDVVTSVVLDDDTYLGPAQVEPAEWLAVDLSDGVVDVRLGDPGQDQEHPEPGLHR
jgi:hypothetical protein